jgi:hypothetical protein
LPSSLKTGTTTLYDSELSEAGVLNGGGPH